MSKKKIVGEICKCGHLKQVHDNIQFGEKHLERDDEHGHIVGRVMKNDPEQFTIKGHGACQMCPCPKFTWVKFVFEDE